MEQKLKETIDKVFQAFKKNENKIEIESLSKLSINFLISLGFDVNEISPNKIIITW